jgi:uncharacterized protein (DUF433 family)
MMIREAEKALLIDASKAMISVASQLAWLIAIDLLGLSDNEAKTLRDEVQNVSLIDSDYTKERFLGDKLMSLPPVKLNAPYLPSSRVRAWENRINTPLSDEVGNDWLWTVPKNYLRFLNEPLRKWDALISDKETPIMSRPEFAITHDPRRCGGDPTVGHTRITVHVLIALLKRYEWDVEAMIVAEQPDATREQINAAIAYYQNNTEEIEAILADQKAHSKERLKEQMLRKRS